MITENPGNKNSSRKITRTFVGGKRANEAFTGFKSLHTGNRLEQSENEFSSSFFFLLLFPPVYTSTQMEHLVFYHLRRSPPPLGFKINVFFKA